MDHLRRFYDILVAADRQPDESPEAWCARLREAMLQQKADLWPLSAPGQPLMIGGVMFAADTVHIAVLPEWQGRWATRRLRRAYDTWTHAIPIRAPIKPDNSKAISLAKRLGFKFQQDQGLYHLYVKEPTHA